MTARPQTTNAKILILEARYYTHINDALLDGAVSALKEAGWDYDVLSVPGALEIPAALKMSLSAGYAGYVILGCIIRGETTHYDVVQNESARGIYNLVLANELALGNAILTVENEAQALARARRTDKDKGGEAARVALRMLEIKNGFSRILPQD